MYFFCLFGAYKFDVHISVHRKYISKVQPSRCNVFWICLFCTLDAGLVQGGSNMTGTDFFKKTIITKHLLAHVKCGLFTKKSVPVIFEPPCTLDAGLLARSQYMEGPATGHLDTGFSWFPCVYK
jgi:hypothetical protein